jgi:hypothetical protein
MLILTTYLWARARPRPPPLVALPLGVAPLAMALAAPLLGAPP